MNFDPDEGEEEFRRSVRLFIERAWLSTDRCRVLFDGWRPAVETGARLLAGTGWLAPGWPVEWSGADLSPRQRYILEEELLLARFPPRDRIGVELAGPVIIAFGTQAQKSHYLPRILSAEQLWCQGFSEAEAGSDINSLRTTATWVGDAYVIEGRKLWTSNAQYADIMLALVKVKVQSKVQPGLTLMLVDMRDPAVKVRKISTIDGKHHFNEVALDGVRVAPSDVVGEVGRGWHNARFILSRERVTLARAPQTRYRLSTIRREVAARAGRGDPLPSAYLLRLSDLEIDLLALEYSLLRVFRGDAPTHQIEGLVSALKVRGAELRQRVGQLQMDLLGGGALLSAIEEPGRPVFAEAIGDLASEYLFDLSGSIAGGTNEIQRNLIAAVALEL
jgi:alkylation response protein AidB-like acyl-CoA dehydrogenase